MSIDLKALRPDAVELHKQAIEFASGDREPADLDLMALVAGAAMLLPIIDQAEAAEAESLEQARLVGMGAERELALMAKLEAAERERDKLRKDADRYRTLRSDWEASTPGLAAIFAQEPHSLRNAIDLDALIDEMAQEGGK